MAQVTIYLDSQTAAKARAAARKAGLSQSRWIAELIRRHSEAEWPSAVLRLAGSWPGFPSAAEMRAGLGEDAPRPPVD
ncbi:MAG: CopG family transcriptional regulator [Gammaproteobacteria bacterium]